MSREKSLALDGKFDYVVGIWFEAALTHQEIHIPELGYKTALNLGLDYTFGLGNGLASDDGILHLREFRTAHLRWGNCSFLCPVCQLFIQYIQQLNGIVFYDWTNNEIYNFVNWSWQFDKWSFLHHGILESSDF